jgi:hypothetical protein
MAKTNSITYRLHSFIYGGAKCGHEGLEKTPYLVPSKKLKKLFKKITQIP